MLVLATTTLVVSSRDKYNVFSSSLSLTDSKKSYFLSNHRALMILFTSVGILAVDFPVFPR